METTTTILTADIKLDQATFRVNVDDSSQYPIEAMNASETKPDWVLWVGKSNDPARNQTSILANLTEGYDLSELAEWINSFNK